MDFKVVWEDMEECQRIGLTKSIGVSNFSCKKLENLLATVKIPPAVNQVEMNPLWQQKKLRELCDRKNVLIVAYSPLGARGTPWQGHLVTESDVLKGIAAANGKSVAQVCLRWLCEQGVGVIVKSFNKERIKENFDIFSGELKQEDVYKMSQIPQHRGYLAQGFIFDEPLTSLLRSSGMGRFDSSISVVD
ncbi:non-functional NADPH-dependent codeinone reductase 2-like [Tripterygium wilfordii]|uniref:Non-functional NADPH-dependent codeinone reductase 2-like n=1 Tax=Tripterygium wilfordii TaxID=458696 RepID=A0A7J7DMD3_TRIWF|nr:non-functional NADPH-dependent codeinone reductase 2-like [Tripterygium wilfordii]